MNEGSQVKVGFSGYRNLDGWISHAVKWTFTAVPLVGCFFILDIPSYMRWTILREQFYGLMLMMILPCVFILVPPYKQSPRDSIPWYDLILAVLGIIVGLYIALFYRHILDDMGVITIDRTVMSTLAIVLTIEATRRTANLILAAFGLFFIILPHVVWMFPDWLPISSIPFTQQVNYLFLDTNGMLGLILGAAVTIVMAFLFFGNLLFNVGGGGFINDIALAIFGRYRGGPAKIAVVASGLFATMSGIAVANVATTGVVTIPLMKKIGYKPHVAGAIEAVASTGGQITPPIMAATAFIMAEILGVPYQQIAIAAIIPAFLYYAAVFFQVDMEAAKGNLKGLPSEQLPRISGVISKCYLFIIPFFVLLIAMFGFYLSPEKSALVGVLSILLLGFFIQQKTQFGLRWIIEALQQTSRAMIAMVPMVVLAGIVIGTISYTGMGFLISLNLSKVAGGNLFFLLPVIAITCFILGMGMPTLCAYILLAVLLGPVMVQLGIMPIAAHLFILFYAIASMVTPPVCIAAYAAAAIADASPMLTGLVSARFAIIKYIIPFLFVFFPALLFIGSPGEIIAAFATATLGCYMLSAGLSGYLFLELNPLKRIISVIIGIGLLIPIQKSSITISTLGNVLSGIFALSMIAWEWYRRKKGDALLNLRHRDSLTY